MSHHDDYAAEPVPGLPERLPEGETMLWQGKPQAMAIARDAFHIVPIGVYFGALALWRLVAGANDGRSAIDIASSVATTLVLGAVVIAILYGIAKLVQRTTIYTLTNRRVVMRFGIAIPITFQFPHVQITGADAKALSGGRGNISLALKEHTKISWPILWPHVRAWRIGRPQPMLRGIDEMSHVAQLLADSLRTAHGAGVTAAAPVTGDGENSYATFVPSAAE